MFYDWTEMICNRIKKAVLPVLLPAPKG